MQKDFKIGLAIGTVLAAGVIIWLATLPNLSPRARALHAASNINPPPKNVSPPALSERSESNGPITSSPATLQMPSDSRATSDEPRATSSETRNISDEVQTANNEQRTTNSGLTQRIHIVQKGDTLSSISAKYYGSARQWRKIVLANRDNLPDPNRLTPGIKLLIPQ